MRHADELTGTTRTAKKAWVALISGDISVPLVMNPTKKSRTQKFRLTLLDSVTGQPIAEELHDSKNPATITAFLTKYLDPSKRTFVVTDIDPRYPGVFKEFFGENLIHQYCLMHLNKLIVADFPRNTTIEQKLIRRKALLKSTVVLELF